LSAEQQTERIRHLIMADLDGELPPEERGELQRVLADDAELREEHERLSRLKEITGMMRLKAPPPEIWEDYWKSVYTRFERGVGWVLLSVGALVLLGWGSWEIVQALVQDEEIPGFAKLAVFGVLGGGVVLLVSVFREKLFLHRRDPYRGVKR
jgi:ferric-dicitrate binding protein FerR (iron transport regulator)